jgi:hypothetical protein
MERRLKKGRSSKLNFNNVDLDSKYTFKGPSFNLSTDILKGILR